jgi:hypothetical protein
MARTLRGADVGNGMSYSVNDQAWTVCSFISSFNSSRWSADRKKESGATIINHYLNNSIARGPPRALAGIKGKGRFFLPRAILDNPPVDLLEAFVPGLNALESAYKSGDLPQEICNEGFMNMMLYLRLVGLQDLVFMQQEMPSHFIFHSNKLFKLESWKVWCVDVLETASSAADPFDSSLDVVAPVIASCLGKIGDTLAQTAADLGSRLSGLKDDGGALASKVDQIYDTVDGISNDLKRFHAEISIPRKKRKVMVTIHEEDVMDMDPKRQTQNTI